MAGTLAILAAAGRGERLGRGLDKPYRRISGLPLIAHCLTVLEKSRLVDRVIITAAPDSMDYCRRLVTRYRFSKVKGVVAGGRRRQDSVWKALQTAGSPGYVLVQDASRPLLSEDLIARSLDAARKHGAAVVSIPVSDTIKMVEHGRTVAVTLPREKLWAAQTPQTFRFSLLRKAYERALEDGFYGTDDAQLVERLGKKVVVVPAGDDNIKVTTRGDIIKAEALIGARKT